MTAVACNGCTACCRYRVALRPDDDPSLYETEPFLDPVTKESQLVLKQVDGLCIYVVDAKCSIHGRAPVTCREFDCRHLFLDLPRSERRAGMSSNSVHREVLRAGRTRLGTLL